jgi:hypothetical protein
MDRDITENYHGGNPESVAAHASLKRRDLENCRAFILRATTRRGKYGMTCDEAEVRLGLSHQTCSARFTDLVKDGRLTRTEETRPTRSGCPARVHIVERA